MRPADFDVQETIQYLEGSCQTLTAGLPDGMFEEELTEKEKELIDDSIFLCACCGWWWEIAQNNDFFGESYCDDCLADSSEEGDDE
jgi:hypothetical protein